MANLGVPCFVVRLPADFVSEPLIGDADGSDASGSFRALTRKDTGMSGNPKKVFTATGVARHNPRIIVLYLNAIRDGTGCHVGNGKLASVPDLSGDSPRSGHGQWCLPRLSFCVFVYCTAPMTCLSPSLSLSLFLPLNKCRFFPACTTSVPPGTVGLAMGL